MMASMSSAFLIVSVIVAVTVVGFSIWTIATNKGRLRRMDVAERQCLIQWAYLANIPDPDEKSSMELRKELLHAMGGPRG